VSSSRELAGKPSLRGWRGEISKTTLSVNFNVSVKMEVWVNFWVSEKDGLAANLSDD
jgi:hypothetical protein